MKGGGIEGVTSLYKAFPDVKRHITIEQREGLKALWHQHPQWPRVKNGNRQRLKAPLSKVWEVYTDTIYLVPVVPVQLEKLDAAEFYTLFCENPVAFTAVQQDFPELCQKKLAEEFNQAYQDALGVFALQQPGIIQSVVGKDKRGAITIAFSTAKANDPQVLDQMKKQYPPEAFFVQRVAREGRYLTAFHENDDAQKKMQVGQEALTALKQLSKGEDRKPIPSYLLDITSQFQNRRDTDAPQSKS